MYIPIPLFTANWCAPEKWKLFSRVWLCPWNSPGQNTGGGSLSLLQGIFPAQGLNQGLPHCRRILYQLSHKGSAPQTYKPNLIMRKTSDKSQLGDILQNIWPVLLKNKETAMAKGSTRMHGGVLEGVLRQEKMLAKSEEIWIKYGLQLIIKY